MPFCPQCAFEYGADVLVCPECNVTLVDRLPSAFGPAAMTPDDSWVGLCRIGYRLPGQTVRGLLDSNNIPSMVMSSAFQPSAGGVSRLAKQPAGAGESEIVMVPREFHEEAELLLSAVLGGEFEALDAPEP